MKTDRQCVVPALPSSAPAELGELLAATALAVPQAQEGLDRHGNERRFANEPQAGEAAEAPCLPPLAFVFARVGLELDLAAEIAPGRDGRPARFLARLPLEATPAPRPANLRVRFEVAPAIELPRLGDGQWRRG